MLDRKTKYMGAAEPMPQQLRARVTDGDYARVRQAAQRNGMRISDYVRAATFRLLAEDDAAERGQIG